MKSTKVASFKVIGISIRTSNGHSDVAKHIGDLWARFMSKGIIELIPNKLEESIYSLYTDYETDYMGAYTAVIGCKVSSFEVMPEGMEGYIVEGGDFQLFEDQGDLTKGAVYQTWGEIWNTELDRRYKADFELYDDAINPPENSKYKIYVGVK